MLHREEIKIAKKSVVDAHFESMVCTFKPISNTLLSIAVLYRPPGSLLSVFFEEFANWLEEFATSPGEVIITGDLNLHVDDTGSHNARRFQMLLESFNLHQHVREATHERGHTLDLVITRMDSPIISGISVMNFEISDHHSVVCKLAMGTPSKRRSKITYRKMRDIDADVFCQDIRRHNLTAFSNITECIEAYDKCLRTLLDKHAPLKTRVVTIRPNSPWYDDELQEAKHERRRRERTWRQSGLASDRERYKVQRNHVNQLLKDAKTRHFSSIVAEQKKNPKKLFEIIDSLINGENASPPLPNHLSPHEVASEFNSFFIQKIELIRSDLSAEQVPLPLPNEVTDLHTDARLTEFRSVTSDVVAAIIRQSPSKHCSLDPIPTWLLKSCLPALIEVITHIINLSFRKHSMPSLMKLAVVSPILKKPGLDCNEMKNFRPVSNLSFISKTLERVAVSQLQQYMMENNLHEKFQSAYRSRHSVETALLRVQNDLLMSLDAGNSVILLLLDLSAAFDTINHDMLLKRLSDIGIRGAALAWFESYLTNRNQFVKIGPASSDQCSLHHGVPQGSVLGPVLFSVYMLPLAKIIQHYGLNGHYYADDTQIYFSFRRPNESAATETLTNCCNAIRAWMKSNMLKLNDSKTEMVVFAPRSQPVSDDLCVSVGESTIHPSTSVRNLGCVMDQRMCMNAQINAICKSGFYHLRNIRRIRRYLSKEVTEQLVHAFVTSRLDFCNALLTGIQQQHLRKLQHVQNAAARVVCELSQRTSTSGALKDLHWLPVTQRIKYKVSILTYRALQGLAPPYLGELLHPYQSARDLRSADDNLLVVPRTKHVTLGDRAFCHAAPVLWNSLPYQLRNARTLELFKSALKTHLFNEAYFNL